MFYRLRPSSPSLRARRSQHLGISGRFRCLVYHIRTSTRVMKEDTDRFSCRLLDSDGRYDWYVVNLNLLFFVMNFQSRFLCVIVSNRQARCKGSRFLTCKEEENDRIRAKKSSGFGESGESGLSP